MLIKKKIPLVVILLVSIPLIIVSILIYYYISLKLVAINKDHIKQISYMEIRSIDEFLISKQREVELMSQNQEVLELLKSKKAEVNNIKVIENSVNALIKNTLENSPDISGEFVVDLDGVVIAGSNVASISLNIKDREYFIEALNGNVTMSNVLKNRADGENVIFVAAPVFDEIRSKVIGVLGNVIRLSAIADSVSKLTSEENGYAYLVDSEGVIIFNSEQDKLGQRIENQKIKVMLEKIKGENDIKGRLGYYEDEDQIEYRAYSVLPKINWVLVVNQDLSVIRTSANFILYIILGITSIVLIVSIFISFRFALSISQPITELMSAMKNATKGDLSVKFNFENTNEFGELSNNFNIMMEKLNLNYEELSAVYEELTASEEKLRTQYQELQHNEEELKLSKEKYSLALEGARDVIWEWNHETNEFFTSDQWSVITGYEVIDKLDFEYIAKNIIHPGDVETVIENLNSHINGDLENYISDFRIRCSDGDYKWLHIRGKAILNPLGKPVKITGSLTDISERKSAEEKISYMAYYDTLTGLPNRVLFMERLNDEMEKAKYNLSKGSILFIDLDNFKNVNDSWGHEYGDRLLELIAEKFQSIKTDNGLICRFAGDEFIVFQPDIKCKEDVIKVAKDVSEIFRDVFVIYEKQVYITASIGIAVYPRDGVDATTLLRNADTAMYKAKETGKNKYYFFDKVMYENNTRRIKIENILRNAIKSDELYLNYQPQFNSNTGNIVGFEALMRLNNKELGIISPAEFIPIAEETGIILEIGEWCLKKACENNKRWKDMGFNYEYIAVNISTVQLRNIDFLQMVKDVLTEVELNPEFLELEITESILMDSLEKNIKVLSGLRNIGVKIALDDFGTGYSSLNYLRMIPIDTLKIDKSFIDGICLNHKEEAITGSIIQMAHKMELEVVAEGVESEEQLNILKEKNCDKIQGYLLSKPLSEEKVLEMLMMMKTYD